MKKYLAPEEEYHPNLIQSLQVGAGSSMAVVQTPILDIGGKMMLGLQVEISSRSRPKAGHQVYEY